MTLVRLLGRLGPLDAASIRRDALLAWVPFAPLLFAVVVRFGWSPLRIWMDSRFGADPTPYEPLVMAFLLLLGPTIAGMVVGFLLLDERDEGVLRALLVSPVSLRRFLAYRLVLPIVLGLVLTWIAYPVAGLVPLPAGHVFVSALLAAMAGPIMALVLLRFAENKVAGFVVVKVANVVNLLPVAAFFLPGPVQWVAAALPTYWPLAAFWRFADGTEGAFILLAGFAVNAGWLALLATGLERRVLR